MRWMMSCILVKANTAKTVTDIYPLFNQYSTKHNSKTTRLNKMECMQDAHTVQKVSLLRISVLALCIEHVLYLAATLEGKAPRAPFSKFNARGLSPTTSNSGSICVDAKSTFACVQYFAWHAKQIGMGLVCKS